MRCIRRGGEPSAIARPCRANSLWIAEGGIGNERSNRYANFLFAIRIDERQRVVENVGVAVPFLGIGYRPLRHSSRIGTRKPALRPTEIPRPKIIEARLGIAFLAGERQRRGHTAGTLSEPSHARHSHTCPLRYSSMLKMNRTENETGSLPRDPTSDGSIATTTTPVT